MSLTEKIRAARRHRVTVGAHTFIVQRPTDLEMLELNAAGPVDARRILRFLVDWEAVNEIDIIPGGSPTAVPFDYGVASEWLGDRLDLMTPIIEGVLSAFSAHQEKQASAQKNLFGGSSN